MNNGQIIICIIRSNHVNLFTNDKWDHLRHFGCAMSPRYNVFNRTDGVQSSMATGSKYSYCSCPDSNSVTFDLPFSLCGYLQGTVVANSRSWSKMLIEFEDVWRILLLLRSQWTIWQKRFVRPTTLVKRLSGISKKEEMFRLGYHTGETHSYPEAYKWNEHHEHPSNPSISLSTSTHVPES